MAKSIQDLINSEVFKDYNFKDESLICCDKQLTSLKGIEKFINLKRFYCINNQLTSLEGIEHLHNLEELYCRTNQIVSLKGIENLKKLTTLDCRDNSLTSLVGIENLENLAVLRDGNNPCYPKYRGLTLQETVAEVYIEAHLKHNDELRGAASIMDTGLFDFKV